MTVYVERVGNRIHARIPYWDGNGPIMAKTVSGANWAKSLRVWTYPLDLQACRDLRTTFGDKLEIGPELWQWASQERAKENQMLALRTSSEASLTRVPALYPALGAALNNRRYQQVGAAFIAQDRNVIIGDEPGLGKTLETLAGLVELDAHWTLVFAPKTAVQSVWLREVQRWLPDAHVVAPSGAKAKRERQIKEFLDNGSDSGTNILVLNTEMARVKTFHACGAEYASCPQSLCDGKDHTCRYAKSHFVCDGKKDDECPEFKTHIKWYEENFPEIFSRKWDVVVSDESHNALLGQKTQVRTGFLQIESANRLALSGTPYRGKLERIYYVLSWLRPDVFTSKWRFINQYFEVGDNGYGKVIGNLMPHRKDAFDKLMATYMLRRTKAEVAPDLPSKMYAGTPLNYLEDGNPDPASVGIWLTMEPVQEKFYRQMEREALARIEGGDLTANGILAEMTRLRQFSSSSYRFREDFDKPEPILPSNKYDWLLDFLDERYGTGRKVVIASQFTSLINMISQQLVKDGHPNYVLTGETSEKQRAALISQFQSADDNVQVFLINTKAGGVAITLDAADELVFLDETFIPDDQIQVEDRIHRVSRSHQVIIYYLRSLGTIEESIAATTGARDQVVRRALDGSRGVDFARQLLSATSAKNN